MKDIYRKAFPASWRYSFVIILVICGTCLCTPLAQAGWILASLTDGTVRKYDSITGTDLGLFASGLNAPGAIGFEPARANNGFAGSVFIAEYNANQVKKYTTGGSLVGNFGSSYNGPEGIAVDGVGNVYVSNYNSQTVHKFGPAGNLLTSFGVGGNPEEIALTASGDLLVNLYSNSVSRYSTSGLSLGAFSSGSIANNIALVIDKDSNVYIGEFAGSQRILKYSPSGGLPIATATLSFQIYGMALNELGQLIVARFGPTTSALYRYDTSLNLLGTFATPPAAPTHLGFVPEPSAAVLFALSMPAIFRKRHRK